MANIRTISQRIIRTLLNEQDDAADFISDFSQSSDKGLGPIPAEHEPHILRAVRLEGDNGRTYYLVLWSTGAQDDYRQNLLGYRFVMPDGQVLWQGTGYRPARSAETMDDDDDVLKQLVQMMLDDPEETGEDTENFTPQQLAFFKTDEAKILMYNYGMDGGMPFIDLPGYERQQD